MSKKKSHKHTDAEIRSRLSFHFELSNAALELFSKRFFGLDDDAAERRAIAIRRRHLPLATKTDVLEMESRVDLARYADSFAAMLLTSIVESDGVDLSTPIADMFNDKDLVLVIGLTALALEEFATQLGSELELALKQSEILARQRFVAWDSAGPEVKKKIETISKLIEKERKRRFGIKRGGKRKFEGAWNDKKKKEFVQAVDSIPLCAGRKAWNVFCDEITFADSDFEGLKSWLLNRPGLEIIPRELLDEATSKWRKYTEPSEIHDPEEKPRSFELRTGLYMIGKEDKYAFNTLKKYYNEGKRLSNP